MRQEWSGIPGDLCIPFPHRIRYSLHTLHKASTHVAARSAPPPQLPIASLLHMYTRHSVQ